MTEENITMIDNIVEGHCLCGSIQFRVEGDALWVAHCHCESCRRNTGSAVATFVGFKPSQLEYLSGQRKIFESSPGVRRGFCPDCGTPLSYETDRSPDEIHLYLCSLDNPERFEAQSHVFYSERVPWFEIADELARHDQLPNS